MERFLMAIVALALLPIASSCKRASTSTGQTTTATQPATQIWLDARITRSHDDFVSEGIILLSHRFTVASGQQATYENQYLRLEVAPKNNGDGTFTIASTVTEHSDSLAPTRTEITVVEGRGTTHQVGGVRLTFIATTNPNLLATFGTENP